MSIKSLWMRLSPRFRNKYFLTLLIFFLWIIIFDRSNWIDMAGEVRKIRQLEKERLYYIEKIAHDRNRLKELRTNNENLEKFAREQYLMKKPDEDIFVITPE